MGARLQRTLSVEQTWKLKHLKAHWSTRLPSRSGDLNKLGRILQLWQKFPCKLMMEQKARLFVVRRKIILTFVNSIISRLWSGSFLKTTKCYDGWRWRGMTSRIKKNLLTWNKLVQGDSAESKTSPDALHSSIVFSADSHSGPMCELFLAFRSYLTVCRTGKGKLSYVKGYSASCELRKTRYLNIWYNMCNVRRTVEH